MDKMDDTNVEDYIQQQIEKNVAATENISQPRRLPRSLNSICVALDELDNELDEEEREDLAAPNVRSFNPSIDTHPAESARDTLVSHPLEFTEQFPHIAIVTTAALPWLTGTAVNPALRAAYLQKQGHEVTLLVPWVVPSVQPRLFPQGVVFHTHEEQRQHVKEAIR